MKMATEYTAGLKLNDLVSRYNVLENDKGLNPELMQRWKNNVLAPVARHRFLLVGPRGGNIWSESELVYVLGKGEKPLADTPYEGIKYATIEIERKQSMTIPEQNIDEVPLVSLYRIVIKTEGKSHPLGEIELKDITDHVVEYHLRESGYYEREKQEYTTAYAGDKLVRSTNLLRKRKRKNEEILSYTRERESKIQTALTHAVERINNYKGMRRRREQRIAALRIDARKAYITGIVHSENWSNEQVLAFGERHRERIKDINAREERFAQQKESRYREVQSAVSELKHLLRSDPIATVEAYAISYTLRFRNGDGWGNTTIKRGDEDTIMEMVSSDPRVSPIPLNAIDSVEVSIWKSLEKETTKPRLKPTITRQKAESAEGYPDLDELLKIPVIPAPERELVGAEAGSQGF